jgi:alpha-ketoglutarate-dependent taurine dioxygenase
MASSAAAWSVRAITPAIGAEVSGVTLSEVTPSEQKELRSLLVRHGVLFFRGQNLTPTQQVAFARGFGQLTPAHPLVGGLDEEHPEVLLLDSAAYPLGVGTKTDGTSYNNRWHTDVTFSALPPMGTVLCAQQVPESGGDTLWASLTDAYDKLSPPLRAFLDPLSASHDAARAFPKGRGGDLAPVTHPVVRVNPDSGRRGLFVNPVFTSHIIGLSDAESEAVLKLLYDHSTLPERVVRWSWRAGDVAVWDNRSTSHYACADYTSRRIMHRVTIAGDAPVGPAVAAVQTP